jgi:hypothetical protein
MLFLDGPTKVVKITPQWIVDDDGATVCESLDGMASTGVR